MGEVTAIALPGWLAQVEPDDNHLQEIDQKDQYRCQQESEVRFAGWVQAELQAGGSQAKPKTQ